VGCGYIPKRRRLCWSAPSPDFGWSGFPVCTALQQPKLYERNADSPPGAIPLPILQWSRDTSKIELKYLKWKRMRVAHRSIISQGMA
jgi:hypothetical protein